MSNAKQIGIALKNFAIDNGVYPAWINPDTRMPSTPAALPNSNAVLATLIPDYIADEQIFGLSNSKWLRKGPDGDISTEGKKLEAGENAWAYVAGFTDTTESRWPLLANAFVQTTGNMGSNGNPFYTDDETAKGGRWKGKKAVVLRCDGSVNIETTYQVSPTRFTIKRDDDPTKNAFTYDAKANWLTRGCAVLQPLPPPPEFDVIPGTLVRRIPSSKNNVILSAGKNR